MYSYEMWIEMQNRGIRNGQNRFLIRISFSRGVSKCIYSGVFLGHSKLIYEQNKLEMGYDTQKIQVRTGLLKKLLFLCWSPSLVCHTENPGQ